MKRSDLEPMIRHEWLKRETQNRTEHDILLFYGFLQQHRPDLLSFRTGGDKYQTLKTILRDLVIEK